MTTATTKMEPMISQYFDIFSLERKNEMNLTKGCRNKELAKFTGLLFKPKLLPAFLVDGHRKHCLPQIMKSKQTARRQAIVIENTGRKEAKEAALLTETLISSDNAIGLNKSFFAAINEGRQRV